MLDVPQLSRLRDDMALAEKIKIEREKRGWSQEALALHARKFVHDGNPENLVQQVIARIEKGRRSKYTKAVARSLDILVTQSDLPFLDIEAKSYEAVPDEALASAAKHFENFLAFKSPVFSSLSGPRDVEELGVAVGGSDGDFDLNGEVIGRQPRPSGLTNRDIFAVRVLNDSMYPRFKDGELVYVERKREPAVGEDAIIEMLPLSESDAPKAFIKEVTGKNSEFVTVRQHNPRKTLRFSRSKIKGLYRIVPWNECFGV